MDQIIDIATDNRHLSRDRGFLKVSEGGEEIGRTALDQIAAVIVHAHGTTWSTSLLTELGERGAPVVLCGRDHAPRSVLLPIEGHHTQGQRMRAQWQARRPLVKAAWKQIVVSKIEMQAAVLDSIGEASAPLTMMRRKVASGDPENVEAQAARFYWPRLMGEAFRRDQAGGGANPLLNYGYTVLRSAAARAVSAAGLHPTIGLFHSNRSNAFALADDLVEPFRPLVDRTVMNLWETGLTEVDPDTKRALARLIAVDIPLGGAVSPVSMAMVRLATSLAQSFENDSLSLALPMPPDGLTLSGLGR
ncbi:MAG: type II CRISPR-associated endonuclease Cas1 [Rhodospirillaceae bacterium]